MKVVAYLGFTLLSILIQFCVVDLTKETIKLDNEPVKLNTTTQKERFDNLLKTFTQKPHALYYRTQSKGKIKEPIVMPSTKVYDNMSVDGMDTTTTNTIIDELYDENSSTTEDSFATESFTSSEFDNVTEISFFEKKNQSIAKPGTPKKVQSKNCICNLLYQVCDINCCCDNDCSDSERKLFVNCKDITKKNKNTLDLCYPHQYFSKEEQNNVIDSLFCIAKINLPERRNINPKKFDVTAITHSYKWYTLSRPKHTEFERKPYVYGEPVWVLKEGSIWYIDIPSPTINNYCSGRIPILFLINMNVKCVVNLNNLEMFHILKTSKEAPCISVTEKSLNSTALNCSTLHCTNWTTIVCDDINCVDYNKSIHEPFCTEDYCTIASKLEYIFYYYDSKIMNATIKLYTESVTSNAPYVIQEISVKFILTNESIERVTELSGNPGYMHGRPVISSYEENNRSASFFNTTSVHRNYLLLPSKKDRICKYFHSNPEFVSFGSNKRIKCRFVYNKSVGSENSSNICSDVERSTEELLGLTKQTFVSPYGNPLEIPDKAWVPIRSDLYEKKITYGNLDNRGSKLRCYNIVTGITYIFTYADVSENNLKKENKIMSANINVTTHNITFHIENVTAVLTIDIIFIDGTKPRMYEYAAGPYINVQLPKDFFFPFRSNASNGNKSQSVILILIMLCNVMYYQMK